MELLRFLHQSLFKLVHVWANVSNTPTGLFIGLPYLYILGWSEKHKSWKMQQFKADSEPRHSTDFRTIFGIMIG